MNKPPETVGMVIKVKFAFYLQFSVLKRTEKPIHTSSRFSYSPMKTHLGLIVLFFISCGDASTALKMNEAHQAASHTHEAQQPVTIPLGKGIQLIRHASVPNNYWDLLEINKHKTDSIPASCMLDTTAQHLRINHTTTHKAFVTFGDYLILSKNQVQAIWLGVYHCKTHQKLASFHSEEVVIDTASRTLYLIRSRGALRNYLLKYHIDADKVTLTDSMENNATSRRKLGLD